jgi:single-strand DNA-binding protein
MAIGWTDVTMLGTTVREPEVRYTADALAVMQVDVAGNDRQVDEDGVLRERPWYHRITAYGRQAERIMDRLPVGARLFVHGHLQQRSVQQADGRLRHTLDVVADRLELFDWASLDPTTEVVLDAKQQPRLKDAKNDVRLIGNVVRDADVREVPGAGAVARVTLAVNGARKPDAEARTHFIDVTAWREHAEACKALKKGVPAYVEGRLVTETWTGSDNVRRWATRVEAKRVERIERFETAAPAEAPAASAAVKPQAPGRSGALEQGLDGA